MGNLSYVPLTDDLIEDLDDADITLVTADANYPGSELKTIPMGTTARGTDPGTGVKIKIDFGENVNPKFWGFLNHDITSGNLIVYPYNDAWITPSGESLTVTYRALDMKGYKAGGGWSAGKRYFLVDLNGCTFSQAFFELGKLVVALDVTTFTHNFSPGVRRGRGNKNIHNVTPAGIEYTHLLQEKINYFGIKWDPDLKETLLDEIIAFIDITNGGGYPSIIIPDNSKTELFYMRNQDITDWNEEVARSMISQCFMNFKELSRGKGQVG